MKAHEIMTRDVIVAKPETSIQDLATLLAEKRISGVPIVDGGKLVGIVSEADLLHRAELGTEIRRKWWLNMFANSDNLAREFTKSHAQKAADIMRRGVVTVKDTDDLGVVAAVLDKSGLKRVPVLADGKLAGIITRADLVRALTMIKPRAKEAAPDEKALFDRIQERLKAERWLAAAATNAIVKGTTVEAWGYVTSTEQKRALLVLLETTDGVTTVEDHLTVNPNAFAGI